MKIADYFLPNNKRQWRLAKQAGVDYGVCRLPYGQKGVDPFSLEYLRELTEEFSREGIKLKVIEPAPPNQKIKLGLPGREEEIEQLCRLITNMGSLGIEVLCYNFMAHIGWFRTSSTTRGRGGALVTSFDYDLLPQEPIEGVGEVSEERLWENYEYFIRSIIPAAEKANVKLALHPDDPPVSPIRGISRIFINFASIRRALELVDNPYHGVTFCQGSFATMDENLPQAINYFCQQKKLFYVHFRDVVGSAYKFQETFHDEGKTDMAKVISLYNQNDFDGYVRVDHVPTMEGESNQQPGYETMGRLFAIGYLKGLMDGIDFRK